MRGLIIGGSGFIGSHVVDRLLADGMRVRVYDRAEERFRRTPSEVDFRQGDFTDISSLAEALVDVDIVFHMLSTSVPSTSNLDPVADIQGNLIGTVRLLELMRSADIKRMVYLSSGGTVYGPPKVDFVSETHPEQPISSYGIVKTAIEKYLLMEAHLFGLNPTILRVSNPYGPRQGHGGVQGVIGTFLWRIAQEEPIQIWGDGSIVRDFLYVDDLARLCVDYVKKGIGGTFNVGSGRGASINDVMGVIEMVTGLSVQPVYQPGRGFDVPRLVLDISKIQTQMGWSPQVSLGDGIERTWEWVKGQKA